VAFPLFHDFTHLYWDNSQRSYKGRDVSDFLEAMDTSDGVLYPWVTVASKPNWFKLVKLGRLDTFEVDDEDSFRVDDGTVQFFHYIVGEDEPARVRSNEQQIDKDLPRLDKWVQGEKRRQQVRERIRSVFLERSDVRIPDYLQGMDQLVADWPHDPRGLRILLLAIESLTSSSSSSGYESFRVLFRIQPGLNVSKTAPPVVPLFDSIVHAMEHRVEPTSILRLARRIVDFAEGVHRTPLHAALLKKMQAYMPGDAPLFPFHDTPDLHVVFRRTR
jgi:hypothetical protein